MSKGLDALNHIGGCYVANESRDLIVSDTYGDDYDIIEKDLKRLEAIDNANPSQAMEKLEKLGRLNLPENYNDLQVNEVEEFSFVKQALLKAQEQEKVLKIIKEKSVLIACLMDANTLEDYNCQVMSWNKLSQEEFDVLKRY